MSSKEDFGRGVAAIRAERKLTQAALAERAGLSLQFLAALEQGKKAPSFETIDDIASALGCTAVTIFERGERTPGATTTADEIEALVRKVPESHHEAVLAVLRGVYDMVRPAPRSRRAKGGRPRARKPTSPNTPKCS